MGETVAMTSVEARFRDAVTSRFNYSVHLLVPIRLIANAVAHASMETYNISI